VAYLQFQAMRNIDSTGIPSCDSGHESITLGHELNCMLLLDYKFTVPKYYISNTTFVGIEVCSRKV